MSDILNNLLFQLSKVEGLLNADKKRGNLIYNYLVFDEKNNFLSLTNLRSYITETTINNITLLNSICSKCANILEMWNIDFEKLPTKELKEPFFYSDFEQKMFQTDIDFHSLYFNDLEYINYNTEIGKKEFVSSFDYRIYTVPEMASKCGNIVNFLTASYPSITVDYSQNYYLFWYKKYKRFSFQNVIKSYKNNEFQNFESLLEKFLINYKFIFENIENQSEFKYDTLDHLDKVKNYQILTKYIVKLDEAIDNIKNNFVYKVPFHSNKIHIESKPDEKNFKNQLLFKVGLLFAEGKVNKYFTLNEKSQTIINSNYSAPKIAKELGNEAFNKYILASLNNYNSLNSNGNKNIFNSKIMMENIIEHCKEEKILIDEYFISFLC